MESKAKTSWFLEALGEVAGFAGRLVKQFLRFFLIGILFTLVLAAVVGYAGSEGLVWKGSLAAVVTLIGGGAVAFAVSAKLSVVSAAAETVKARAVGQQVLDALFSRLLGVTAENPQGDHDLTRKLHGLPVREVENVLNQAGRAMLDHPVAAAAVPRIGLWLANRVQRVLVWATVRVVVAYCTAGKSRDESIDLLALRTSLAREVDELVVRKLQQGTFRFMIIAALLVAVAGWILVKVLHLLPGG